MKQINEVGKRYGRLTVIALGGRTNKSLLTWRCRCDCGNDVVVRGPKLRYGVTRSCGCLRAEGNGNRKHGKSSTSTYHAWSRMMQRCYNRNNKRYADYGGRGITVAPEWRTFDGFYRDMGDCPPGHSIERVRVNEGYSKTNCKWIPMPAQAKNKRNNHWVTIGSETHCLTEWCRRLSLNRATVKARLKQGWDDQKSLLVPIRKRRASVVR